MTDKTDTMPALDAQYRLTEARVQHAEYGWRVPDFREYPDGTLRREYRLSPLELAQQDMKMAGDPWE